MDGSAGATLGVRTANLVEPGEPEQLSILDLIENAEKKENDFDSGSIQNRKTREKMKKLDEALDAIKGKYGENAVYRARFMKNKK